MSPTEPPGADVPSGDGQPDTTENHRPSRRGFLVGGAASLGAAGLGAAAAGSATAANGRSSASAPGTAGATAPTTVPFLGRHQAGIADVAPAHALFLAFDLEPGYGKDEVGAVLQEWTALAESLAEGDTSGDRTSITAGSNPAMFTTTVGVGGGLLDRLALPRPAALVDLPVFPGDQLVPQDSHGDVVLQLCSNDAVYAAGAARAMRTAARGVLRVRWQLAGFRGAAASTSASNGRNLMGQIDGTNNIAVSRESDGGAVWVDRGDRAWMTGGTYLALRRFRMRLTEWEGAAESTRDASLGRHIRTGAPLGQRNEFDPVDLDAVASDGGPVIPVDSHIRLAAPRPDAGEEMLRRSYSYSAGEVDGAEDAGLIFTSFQVDPTTSFIPVQQRLAESDALSRFTVATSSALFAILPGVQDSHDWFGRALLS